MALPKVVCFAWTWRCTGEADCSFIIGDYAYFEITQGLIGWWMVRSGLGEDNKGSMKEIRVSPYRLSVHLAMAFTTFSGLVWTGEFG